MFMLEVSSLGEVDLSLFVWTDRCCSVAFRDTNFPSEERLGPYRRLPTEQQLRAYAVIRRQRGKNADSVCPHVINRGIEDLSVITFCSGCAADEF